MLKKLQTGVALLVVLASLPSLTAAGETAKVTDLGWMTGSWAGPMGAQTLEENWTQPMGSSILSFIRFTGDGQTGMIEMIVIEEEGDSLVFRVRQWLPGFVPRTTEPQTMTLAAIGERQVSFEAESGAFRRLTYSRPTAESFNIDVETRDGQTFQINLRAQ